MSLLPSHSETCCVALGKYFTLSVSLCEYRPPPLICEVKRAGLTPLIGIWAGFICCCIWRAVNSNPCFKARGWNVLSRALPKGPEESLLGMKQSRGNSPKENTTVKNDIHIPLCGTFSFQVRLSPSETKEWPVLSLHKHIFLRLLSTVTTSHLSVLFIFHIATQCCPPWWPGKTQESDWPFSGEMEQSAEPNGSSREWLVQVDDVLELVQVSLRT